MHIVLINRWYPHKGSGYGGVAMYNRCVARALTRLGHRVTVIANRWPPELPPAENDDGVLVQRLRVRNRRWLSRLPIVGRYGRFLQQLAYSFRVAWRLRKLEVRDRPDVIEIADVDAEGFAYLLRRRRCPVVIRCHTPSFVLRQYYNSAEAPYDTSLIALMEKFCIRQADALTAPSLDMAETIARECPVPLQRIAVIPNALDVEDFAGVPGVLTGDGSGRPAGDEFTVLHVGRLERAKGAEVLAQVIPVVLEQVPNARFVFVGEDRPDGHGTTWRERLQRRLRECRVNGQVSFLGEVDQAALLQWYRRADLAVVPSLLYESFSYTCAQAMAAGVPVVASRIGGISETVGDQHCGLLVEPGDAQGLALAIIRLARDPTLRGRLAQAGRAKAASFASDRVAGELIELYNSARASRDLRRELK